MTPNANNRSEYPNTDWPMALKALRLKPRWRLGKKQIKYTYHFLLGDWGGSG